MALDLHRLEIFFAVARQHSFTRAAEELYISQPAVSAQIKRLEEELGVELFRRGSREVELTPPGQVLFERTRAIFRLAREAEAEIEALKGLISGRLVIGASTTPGTYLLPPLLGEFKRRHPNLSLDLEIANSLNIAAMVEAGELELGVIGGDISSKKIDSEPLVDDELIAIAPPGHHLAGGHPISLKELAQEPAICREPGSGTQRNVLEAFAAAGAPCNPILELGSTCAVVQAVQAELGVAIVPARAVQAELALEQVVRIPLTGPPICRMFRVIYASGIRLSPAARAFRELLHEARTSGALVPGCPAPSGPARSP